jgi:nucleotide sugar dehydrogenase
VPLIEEHSNLVQGVDFHAVYSPERVSSGTVFDDLRRYPKLVGGLTQTGLIAAKKFYESALDFDSRDDLRAPNGVWVLEPVEAVEMAKLAETTYRNVNIALANQFAIDAEKHGVDIYQVIEACNSQPFSNIHMPGISVGGHCIPVYNHLYLSSTSNSELVRIAHKVNAAMPERAVASLEAEIGSLSGLTVGILGIAYRPGVKEIALSGALRLFDLFKARGAIPEVLDPLYSEEEVIAAGMTPLTDFHSPQALVLHTAHSDFLALSQEDFPHARVIYDGRNFLQRNRWTTSKVVALGKPRSTFYTDNEPAAG